MAKDLGIRDTLTRIKQSANATEATSQAAAVRLEAQGQEISRISTDTEKIQDQLDISARLIRGIESLTGRMTNWFTSTHKSTSITNSTDKSPSLTTETAPKTSTATDQDLDEISNTLASIKARSLEISRNIQLQNASLDKVNSDFDSHREAISAQHSRIRKK